MPPSLSQSLSLAPRLSQKLRLTITQRVVLENYLFGLRLELIGAARELWYEPFASCPNCRRSLTPIEILDGFEPDPYDITTKCPLCNTRFAAKIKSRTDLSTVEVPFLCADQVLEQLSGLENTPPEEIAHQYPSIFHSAIIHFGSLKRAFHKKNIQYPYLPVDGWRGKIEAYLGKLPDTVIGSIVGIDRKSIGKLRRELGIPSYSKRDTAKSLGYIEN